jgi:hypothetical protein
MDEMTEYRERIERRFGDRRTTNDRREAHEYAKPSLFPAGFVAQVVFLMSLGLYLYFAK